MPAHYQVKQETSDKRDPSRFWVNRASDEKRSPLFSCPPFSCLRLGQQENGGQENIFAASSRKILTRILDNCGAFVGLGICMSYSNFTITELEKRFGLDIVTGLDLFDFVAPVEISAWLVETLTENVPVALAVSTEKARSEFIVAPILTELRKRMNHQISLFSGVEFNVDPASGLTGVCDFLITCSTQQLVVEAPIITMVEAKNDNLKSAVPQCLAEMVAAQVFNERENVPIQTVYGAVTTGSAWNFIALRDRHASVDLREYSIKEPGKVLGILLHMLNQPTPN